MLTHPTTEHLRELGLAGMARALEEMRRQPDAAALDFEAEGQAECFRSPDFVEGVTAFMQKRPPRFGKGGA